VPVAELNAEQYESLPDFVKGDYEQNGDIFRPVAEGKLTALKGSMNDLDAKYKQASQSIADIERSKAEAIEQARKEGLEQAKSRGEVSEVEKRYEEQMTHLRDTYESKLKESDETKTKLYSTIKERDTKLEIKAISKSLNVFDDSFDMFESDIKSRVDIDPVTGKKTYLDASGGATSLDLDGFVEALKTESKYDRLRQKDVNQGGSVNGNLNNGGGAASSSSIIKESAKVQKKNGNLAGFLQAQLSPEK